MITTMSLIGFQFQQIFMTQTVKEKPNNYFSSFVVLQAHNLLPRLTKPKNYPNLLQLTTNFMTFPKGTIT